MCMLGEVDDKKAKPGKKTAADAKANLALIKKLKGK